MRLQPPSGSGTPIPDKTIEEEEMVGDVPKRLAIIGMSCRLPGQVTTADDLWDMCSRKKSTWSEIPKSRFNSEGFYHGNPDRPGSFNNQGAHFLTEDVGLFDAPFFSITLQEARSMDPQQRIMLECVYEALENAGISSTSIIGKNVGVFAGASHPDYDVNNSLDAENIPMLSATGTATALQSNRVSYYFNLHGPSVTIDTACSSSLAALHLASQSIRNGECKMAIVGGCHLNLLPEAFISMTQSRLLASTGKTYAFDHRATGFGRGEGAGCIILKSLEEAEAAGDAIRSVIVNSGINQDGRTRGITMPNSEAQEKLMREVYKKARIDPAMTGFVEAHGTGTKVGDPLEARALNAVFGIGRTPKQPLFIGSLKSNVGHLEGSSGIVSVIKTALMLERGFVLPNCNFDEPNEEIPMDKWNMKVPKKLVPWPRGKTFASVNNFGFGGSNAHVVLERGPIHGGQGGQNEDPLTRRVYVVSGYDKQAASKMGDEIISYLHRHPPVFTDSLMDNLAYTLGQRRTHFQWRMAVPASVHTELIDTLAGIKEPTRSTGTPSIGFVFTGQGAQWHGMGKELLQRYPVFSKTMQDFDACLKTLGATFSIIDEIQSESAEESKISAAYMSQPACTAVQLALVDLLSSWDIKPEAVVGHSSGEIAAAYAAKILTLEECVRIAYCRGVAADLVAKDSTVNGAMLAVGANAGEVQQILDAMRGQRAVIACVNSNSSITLSGDRDVVTDLQTALDKEGIFTRMLHVDVAYHSHHMQKVSQQYRSLLGKIAPQFSAIPFHSTVYGKEVPASALDAGYWVENLVSRVEFVKGVQSLWDTKLQSGKINTLVEVGPHPALQNPVKDIIQSHDPKRSLHYAHTLHRKLDGIDAVQELAASMFTQGLDVNFKAINFPNKSSRKPQVLTNLPTYPWNHSERYWFTSRLGSNLFHRKFPRSDLLGSLCIENLDIEPRWRNILRADDHPWIRQHRVHDNNVFPMTGFLAMAMEAIKQQATMHNISPGKIELRDISINRALSIPDNTPIETMFTLCPSRNQGPGASGLGWHEFKVFSWTEGRGWEQHCNGLVTANEVKESNPIDGSRQKSLRERDLTQTMSKMQASCISPVDSKTLYENIASGGVNYGPLFQGLSHISVDESRQALASICVPNTKSTMPNEYEVDHIAHPATLDLCCQVMWLLQGFGQPGRKQTFVPSHLDRVTLSLDYKLSAGAPLQLFGFRSGIESPSTPESNRIFATRPGGSTDVVIEIDGMNLVPISNDIKGHKGNRPDPMCYKVRWEPCFETLSEDSYRQIARPQVDDGKGGERMHHLENIAVHWLRKLIKSVPEEEIPTFQSHHQKFYRWAQQTCKTSPVQEISPELIEQTRNANGAGRLNCFVGERLPGILRGKDDALTLMLEDDMLGDYYQDLDGLRESYANASVCIDKMAHQNPDLNILEIGAGTGGATLPILECLGGNEPGSTPRFGHYTYTDISPGFFEKAKAKFEGWNHLMTYQTLDVSTDPVEQGFKSDTYDLVIACNVLHATSNINETMANIRTLMKPGGKIMLIEETKSTATHFPFALLPGWWLANEEVRQDGPLLTQEGWSRVMQANDFSGVDICVEGYPGASYQTGCVMVSTANTLETGPKNPGDIIIIDSDSIGSVSSLSLDAGLRNITGVAPTNASDLSAVDITDKWCIFLGGMDRSILANLTSQKFQEFQRLVSRARGLLWIVRHTKSDPQSLGSNMAIGLARTVRSETGVHFATLDLGDKESMPDAEAVQHMINVFDSAFCHKSQLNQGDMEFVVRNGHVSLPRLLDNPALNLSVQLETSDAPPQLQMFKQDRALRLTAGQGRVLDELYFTDDASRNTPLPDDHIEIRVRCTGLNFRDVLMAMGQLRGDKLGQECSGVVSKVGAGVNDFSVGDRVSAMSPGSLSTYTRCPASCAWVIPSDMPWSIAASIPAVFCTAYYSLIELGRLSHDESVLIHAAAGGVGQAAIIIAQNIGANIFATVGSVEKKEFLIKTYGIKEEQIFFSRDLSFAKGILNATGGEGVDVALNSLSGDALQATFECIAPFGRFIELGKRDITQNSRLEMAHFHHNVSFASVDLGVVREKRPKLTRRLMREAFYTFAYSNAHKRWPVTTIPISEVENGFRALQGGQVIGKMVVEMTDDAMVKVHPARKEEKLLRADSTYIVVGGTSGIGLDIASWMPQKGATHIVLVSRSGASTDLARETIQDLTSQGITVEVCRCDISCAERVQESLRPLLARLPTVRGVIYGAMVLRDTLFEKLSLEDYEAVIKPRIHGIWNLQNTLQSSTISSNLDFFITLSSAASFVGNLGQSPYAASGTFMAALAAYPKTSGVPYTTIDLPIVRGVGYLSDDSKREEIAAQLGTESVDATDIRGLVAAAMRNEMQETCNGHCVVGFDGVKTTPASEQPFWVKDTKLCQLLRLSTLAGTGALSDAVTSNDQTPPATAIRQCQSRDAAEAIIVTALAQKLSSILMRPMEEMNPAAPIAIYGLDSLVAIEIRNWITRELEANMQVLEILAGESLPALSEHIMRKSGIITSKLKTEWGLDVPEARPNQD
ncbi:hypothetical protein N7478_001028 [Penicillium angulare]|uniref:uncharacterized protein n=1 Tax=Penicillium angulare TaxID=116970 RepID=UPI002541730B|nr:uncharacterized protein N7478_001028 [Penicillium angulare]KAJ5291777.1 hypothetical protein N7478_001028 [Penicillium angulare]